MSTDAPGLRGDEAQLFELHAAELRSVVGRQVRTSRANVEDACSFAWVQMLRNQPPRDRLMGWLCRTATREAIKLDRRSRRCSELPEDQDVGPQAAAGSFTDERLEVLVAREAIAAAQLRDREADLLGLHLAGYSYAETAELCSLTTRTVERQLLRAKRKLRSARLVQLE